MRNSATLADRIRARLSATGKSASAVSLEAGLSRSAIRDILNGKAGNPRMDTLLKLAGPLGCSVAYLSGHSDNPASSGSTDLESALGVRTIAVRTVLKQGVYIDTPETLSPEGALVTITVPEGTTGDVALYRQGDDSLAAIGILKDDLIIAETVSAPGLDALSPGAVVIVQRALAGLSNGPFEYSARLVAVKKGAVSLVTAPRMAPEKSLLIDRRAITDSNDLPRIGLHPVADGTIKIEGFAVRTIRDLPKHE